MSSVVISDRSLAGNVLAAALGPNCVEECQALVCTGSLTLTEGCLGGCGHSRIRKGTRLLC